MRRLMIALFLTGASGSASAEPFFPQATGKAVARCSAAARAFDTKRIASMAQAVVKACEADADTAKGKDCVMYAVRVSTAASKFIGQMQMIQNGNPGWAGQMAVIQSHNEQARGYASRCRA